MKLPSADKASVPEKKLTHYLLSEDHPVGRSKAAFLKAVGFVPEDVFLLKEALLRLAREGVMTKKVSSEHGTKYLVEGDLLTPSHRKIKIRTLWIVDKGGEFPRFVTAYPL